MAGLILTDRDVALLASLCEYRVLTTEQLLALHFDSRQTMLRRVRRLARAGYLRVVPAPTLGTRIVQLAEQGRAELPGDAVGGSRPPRRQPSPMFLPHHVAVSEFRLQLQLACAADSEVELVRFIPDSERRTIGGSAQPRPYIREEIPDPSRPAGVISRVPDAVFALSRGSRTALFFLEVDRGTEVIGHPERGLSKIARFYSALLADGRYQRYADDMGATEPFRGFRALLVLPSDRRLRNARELCGMRPDVPGPARRFIWLATAAALYAGDLLGQPWVSLDPTDATCYVLDGGASAGRVPA
jgi:hypothetical protein